MKTAISTALVFGFDQDYQSLSIHPSSKSLLLLLIIETCHSVISSLPSHRIQRRFEYLNHAMYLFIKRHRELCDPEGEVGKCLHLTIALGHPAFDLCRKLWICSHARTHIQGYLRSTFNRCLAISFLELITSALIEPYLSGFSLSICRSFFFSCLCLVKLLTCNCYLHTCIVLLFQFALKLSHSHFTEDRLISAVCNHTAIVKDRFGK